MRLFGYLGPLPFFPTLAARACFLLLAEMFLHKFVHGLECQSVDFVDVDLDLVWVGLHVMWRVRMSV